MTARNQALTPAYKELCKELSASLYNEDPAGMGTTVGAPGDEYDGEAARIAAALRNIRSREEIGAYLKQTYGKCSGALIDQVEGALIRFRTKSETATQEHSEDR